MNEQKLAPWFRPTSQSTRRARTHARDWRRWAAVKTKNVMLLVVAVIAANAAAAEDQDALRAIADQLSHVRSSATGTDVDVACPKKSHLARLRGLTRSAVFAQLSAPDFEDDDTSTSSWSYFMTNRIEGVVDRGEYLEVTRGGGFPIITFAFNQQGKVQAVTCTYAR
jgi:hypothetical protein